MSDLTLEEKLGFVALARENPATIKYGRTFNENFTHGLAFTGAAPVFYESGKCAVPSIGASCFLATHVLHLKLLSRFGEDISRADVDDMASQAIHRVDSRVSDEDAANYRLVVLMAWDGADRAQEYTPIPDPPASKGRTSSVSINAAQL